MPKKILHNVKRRFHECTHRGLGPLHRLERFVLRAFGHRFDRPARRRDLPGDFPIQRHNLLSFFDPGVTVVGMDLLFLAVQQVAGYVTLATFAAGSTTGCTRWLSRSAPRCAFIPKCHGLPFLV